MNRHRSLFGPSLPLILGLLLLFASCKTGDAASDPVDPPDDPVPGTAWYVSVDGDDGAAGTENAPFRTISHALELCEPGATVVLGAGTYLEAIRIRQPRITIRSRSGERAIIQAPTDDEEIAICVECDVDASGGTLQDLEIVGGFYYALSFETRWDWGEADRSGASDMTVEHCLIHHSGRDCIKIKPGCDRITIRDCEIHHSGAGYPAGTADDDKNAEGIDNVNGDGMIVSGCNLHDIATTGIYFKGGASGCRVDSCRIDNCGLGGVLIGFDTSPEYFDLSANPGYYEAIEGTVQNCIISCTAYAGIGLYASRDCLVAHNTLIDTASRGHAPLYFGITYQDWEPEALRPPNLNPRLINNLVSQGGAFPSTLVFIRASDDLGGLSALSGMPTMSHNLYFSTQGTALFTDQRADTYLEDGPLATWQAHIRGDANSFSADPLLDETGHLRAGSPAQERGLFLSAVDHDFDGDPRGTPPDIGADER